MYITCCYILLFCKTNLRLILFRFYGYGINETKVSIHVSPFPVEIVAQRKHWKLLKMFVKF